MDVIYDSVDPGKISYKHGLVYETLTGFNAWMYRSMIGMYWKAEATEKFWWLWHKKEA